MVCRSADKVAGRGSAQHCRGEVQPGGTLGVEMSWLCHGGTEASTNNEMLPVLFMFNMCIGLDDHSFLDHHPHEHYHVVRKKGLLIRSGPVDQYLPELEQDSQFFEAVVIFNAFFH
jgi:hypothetical protein